MFVRSIRNLNGTSYIIREPRHKGRPNHDKPEDQDNYEYYEKCHLNVDSTFEAKLSRFSKGAYESPERFLDETSLHPIKCSKSLRID